MKRFVLQQLIEWKNREDRKPLILNGARQVGKTWLLHEFAKLEYKKEAYVDSLSRGMKQRLCLARSLIHDPKLLILDEPLHGLDTYNRRRVKKIIEAFCHRKDKTMIMVTHYESELPGTITDRIFLKRNR